MVEKNENGRSITSARGYIAYLLAEGQGSDLPPIPARCVISYTSSLIDSLKAGCAHTSLSLGITNPMQLHFFFPEAGVPFAMARGMHGAPMAAILLEELIALGFEEFLVIGPAGHPSNLPEPRISVGELVLATQAMIFEGTSPHYGRRDRGQPGSLILDRIGRLLGDLRIPALAGTVATTDALYRETVDFIEGLAAGDVLAVDMEMSALYTVAESWGKQLGGLLFISDIVRTDGVWDLGRSGADFEVLSRRLADLVRAFVEAS